MNSTKSLAIVVLALGGLLTGLSAASSQKQPSGRVPSCCANPCPSCADGCDECPLCAVDCSACCGAAKPAKTGCDLCPLCPECAIDCAACCGAGCKEACTPAPAKTGCDLCPLCPGCAVDCAACCGAGCKSACAPAKATPVKTAAVKAKKKCCENCEK